MSMMIECGYCGSVYDFNEHRACPNCAAIPDKAQINAAKAEAKAAARAEAEARAAAVKNSSVPSTGKFMFRLIKLIPVWIAFIFIIIWIPGIKKAADNKKIMQSMQVIDEPVYEIHELGENFVYDKILEIAADEAFIADSDAVNALMPEGFRLLAVHISASSGGSAEVNDYYDIDPYIIDGKLCRAPISSSALRSLPDAFAQTSFYFYSLRYEYERDGYLCFMVGDDTESVELCFEETHMQNRVRQLDCVHKISIDISEVQQWQ